MSTPDEQPTPETDAFLDELAAKAQWTTPRRMVDHARKLERERNEWRDHAVEWGLENITLNADIKKLSERIRSLEKLVNWKK